MRIHITHRLATFLAVVSIVSLAACGIAPTAVTSEADLPAQSRVTSSRASFAGAPSATLDSANAPQPQSIECDDPLGETCRAIQPWY
jgi:hypothetical protein